MKRFSVVAVVVWLGLLAGSVRAQMTAPPGPFEGFKSGGKDPIELSADRMEADLGLSAITFIGHVAAKQGERTIYAERMHIVYTEGGEVTSLDADGNVKVRMKDAFATSDRLRLDNRARWIKLLGRPRVVQGKQIVTGEEIVYYMDKEQLKVIKPRIEWIGDGAPAEAPVP